MGRKKENLAENMNQVQENVSNNVANETNKFVFDREKFSNRNEYKQEWIVMSEAFQQATRLPGIPKGHVTMVYGKSDTGKTTFMLQVAKHAQQSNVLPVFIITEHKFSLEHAQKNGVDIDNAIFFDEIFTLEDGVQKILEILEAQKKKEIPYDLIFLWDSIGMTPSKNDFIENEKDVVKAQMMATSRAVRNLFVRTLAPRINASRLKSAPFTNTLFVISHAYTTPARPPLNMPSLEPFGGDGMFLISSLVFRMGGIMTRAQKLYAVKDKVKVAYGIKTKIVLEKNHITNVSAQSEIICTDQGFILDVEEFKKNNRDNWEITIEEF